MLEDWIVFDIYVLVCKLAFYLQNTMQIDHLQIDLNAVSSRVLQFEIAPLGYNMWTHTKRNKK